MVREKVFRRWIQTNSHLILYHIQPLSYTHRITTFLNNHSQSSSIFFSIFLPYGSMPFHWWAGVRWSHRLANRTNQPHWAFRSSAKSSVIYTFRCTGFQRSHTSKIFHFIWKKYSYCLVRGGIKCTIRASTSNGAPFSITFCWLIVAESGQSLTLRFQINASNCVMFVGELWLIPSVGSTLLSTDGSAQVTFLKPRKRWWRDAVHQMFLV